MRTLRALAVPTGTYLAVTVAVPAVNGGAWDRVFWLHAGSVLLACAAVLGVIAGARLALAGRWPGRR